MHGNFGPRDIISVFGLRDCGKTHLAKRVLENFPRKVIFDVMGDYESYDLVESFDEFCVKLLRLHDVKEFTLVYRMNLEPQNEEQQKLEFNEALGLLFKRGDVLVDIEEVHEFCTPHQMPKWMRRAILLGAHRNMALLFTSQRPGDCHKRIISQAKHVFCGFLHEKNDLEYCRSMLGDQVEGLPKLPDRQFLYLKLRSGVVSINNDLEARAPEAAAA